MFLFIKHQALYKLYVKLKIVCWKLLLLKKKLKHPENVHPTNTQKKEKSKLGEREKKNEISLRWNWKNSENLLCMKKKKEVFYYFSLLYSHHQPTNQQHHRKIPHSKSHIQIKIHSKQTNDERNQQQQQIIIYSFFLQIFFFAFSCLFFLLLSWLNNNKNATRKKVWCWWSKKRRRNEEKQFLKNILKICNLISSRFVVVVGNVSYSGFFFLHCIMGGKNKLVIDN